MGNTHINSINRRDLIKKSTALGLVGSAGAFSTPVSALTCPDVDDDDIKDERGTDDVDIDEYESGSGGTYEGKLASSTKLAWVRDLVDPDDDDYIGHVFAFVTTAATQYTDLDEGQDWLRKHSVNVKYTGSYDDVSLDYCPRVTGAYPESGSLVDSSFTSLAGGAVGLLKPYIGFSLAVLETATAIEEEANFEKHSKHELDLGYSHARVDKAKVQGAFTVWRKKGQAGDVEVVLETEASTPFGSYPIFLMDTWEKTTIHFYGDDEVIFIGNIG